MISSLLVVNKKAPPVLMGLRTFILYCRY